MSDEEVARFIQHFERVTRVCLERLPDSADVVLKLTPTHEVAYSHYRDAKTDSTK